MASPPWLNLKVPRGDPYALELAFVDDDGEAEPLAVGKSWSAQVRASFTAASAVDFDVDDSDRALGIVRISLTSDQTRLLAAGTLVWGFVEIEDGEPATLVQGGLIVQETVVR